MTREEIHNEIGNILKLIEINNNRMFLNDADFELDVELMKSYIVQLYKLQEQLRISEPDTVTEPEPPKKEEPLVIKAKPKARTKPPVVEQPEPVDDPTSAPEPEPIPESVPEPEIEEESVPEPDPVIEEPEPTKVVEEPTPAPKPEVKKASKKPAPTGEANDVYARLKNTKLDSIKKGISISKRYEMQNELFANNPEAYNNAIQTLDNQNSFDEAMSILEGSLMTEHGWEEEDFLVDELRILLYRRYA